MCACRGERGEGGRGGNARESRIIQSDALPSERGEARRAERKDLSEIRWLIAIEIESRVRDPTRLATRERKISRVATRVIAPHFPFSGMT